MTEPDSPHHSLDPFEREACELLLTSRPAVQASSSVTPSKRLEQRGNHGPNENAAHTETEVRDFAPLVSQVAADMAGATILSPGQLGLNNLMWNLFSLNFC